MVNRVEIEIGGRSMVIESGKIAKQANGAVTVRYADSMVVSTVCAQTEPKKGFDFFGIGIPPVKANPLALLKNGIKDEATIT